jgi:hypothetical protein
MMEPPKKKPRLKKPKMPVLSPMEQEREQKRRELRLIVSEVPGKSEFVSNAMKGDLKEIPGINDAIVLILKHQGIETSFQLFAKVLLLRSASDEESEELSTYLCVMLYQWFVSIFIPPENSIIIVDAICSKLKDRKIVTLEYWSGLQDEMIKFAIDSK